MKEADYVAAQSVTRLRIACDVLREAASGEMGQQNRAELFRLLDGLCALRDKCTTAIVIEDECS